MGSQGSEGLECGKKQSLRQSSSWRYGSTLSMGTSEEDMSAQENKGHLGSVLGMYSENMKRPHTDTLKKGLVCSPFLSLLLVLKLSE